MTTKTKTSMIDGTITAGTPTTSSAVDLSTVDLAWITAKITNGGTAPTLPAELKIEVAHETSSQEWFELPIRTAGLTASGVYSFPIPVHPGVQSIRATVGENTVEDVTAKVFITTVTA